MTMQNREQMSLINMQRKQTELWLELEKRQRLVSRSSKHIIILLPREAKFRHYELVTWEMQERILLQLYDLFVEIEAGFLIKLCQQLRFGSIAFTKLCFYINIYQSLSGLDNLLLSKIKDYHKDKRLKLGKNEHK